MLAPLTMYLFLAYTYALTQWRIACRRLACAAIAHLPDYALSIWCAFFCMYGDGKTVSIGRALTDRGTECTAALQMYMAIFRSNTVNMAQFAKLVPSTAYVIKYHTAESNAFGDNYMLARIDMCSGRYTITWEGVRPDMCPAKECDIEFGCVCFK